MIELEKARPRIGVFKFSSCSGCQLEIIDMENELLDLAQAVEIGYFLEAVRSHPPQGAFDVAFDVAFVEGSISTPEEAERIKKIREQAKTLVAMGACATVGGIQALRNWWKLGELKERVYPQPEMLECLEWSTGIDMYVPVDASLCGCPISKTDFIEFVTSALIGRTPNLKSYPVCVECKLNGNECVLVKDREPCLGPVVRAGCNSICPAFSRPCYGCFGPAQDINVEALAKEFEEIGLKPDEIVRKFRYITGNAEEFRKGAKIYE